MKQFAFALSALALALPGATQAATYFGEDLTPGGTVGPNSAAAQSSFSSQLSGVSTESFESFTLFESPASLTFNGSAGTITATIGGGDGQVCSLPDCGGVGRFATDGDNWYDVSDAFSLSFDTPVAAFGFYGMDIGDINGQMTLTLLRTGQMDELISIPNTANALDGSILFFGVIDETNPFDGLQFGNTAQGSDFFGFDEMIIGDPQQVTGGVPEPSTWALMLLGMFGIGGTMRSRKVKASISYA